MNSRIFLLITFLAAVIGFSGLARAEEVVICGESNGGLVSTFYIDLTEGTVRTAIAGVEWGKAIEKMRTFRAKIYEDRIEWKQLVPSYYSLDRHSLILERLGALENELSRNCRVAQQQREDRSDVAIPHTVTLYEDGRYRDLDAGSLVGSFESLPADPQVKRTFGSVIWRTENVRPRPGEPPEQAIRAELEVTTPAQVQIPERKLAMSLSIRRNTDDALPASHTVETIFKLPSGSGGVSDVPGIAMKDSEFDPGRCARRARRQSHHRLLPDGPLCR